MSHAYACDEELLHRLPLPLAQLYRRAHNAKTSLERHLAALSLWEATLKLLAAGAVVEYAERGSHDPQLAERLQSLARPSLGHWWEFVRLLVPALADAGDAGFTQVRDLVLGRSRDDLPRCAGLDAVLREELEGKPGSRATVRLTELFDRLVTHRNKGVAHAAPGQRAADYHERLAAALLAALTELLGRLDVLAGRRLLYVGEVRQVGGVWLVQRFELHGESARRIASLELPREAAARLPDGERVYLLSPPVAPGDGGEPGAGELRSLHPLLLYDAEAEEALFLNARRGRRRTEYLCYTSGRTADRADLGAEQRRLLAHVLGMEVAEEQAEDWAARAGEAQPAGEAEPAPAGRRLVGEFELLSELGRGGMGVVYRAWQPSLGRQVALKCLGRSGDAKAEARFRREIRALGRVEHPHLVKVFTSGSDGDQWFYAMELVEGVPLAAVCAQLQTKVKSVTEVDLPAWRETLSAAWQAARQAEKPLGDAQSSPLAERVGETGSRSEPTTKAPAAGGGYVRHVVGLVRQVAEAAHALHEKGIVHRDIKPGNILMSGDGGQAVLMDLGLAQLADDMEGRVTRTRQFVGTLRYASPEQVLAVGGLDHCSDVYSLGATLWELLALRPLYGATDETPSPELMRRIQYEEPGRLRQCHPGLPRDLEAVAHRCLEKDAKRRYATARELAQDLGRYLAGEPVRARRVGRVERGWKWVKRHPWPAGLAASATVLVLLLVAGGVALSFDSEVRGLNSQLQTALKEVKQQQAKAETARQQAEANEQLARQFQYDADINLAQRAWQESALQRVDEVLEQYRPGPDGRPDLRGLEWSYLWRLSHGEVLSAPHAANCLAFSPDGRWLASGAGGSFQNPGGVVTVPAEVKFWDARTGHEAFTLKTPEPVNRLAFSLDGKRLATVGDTAPPRVWDLESRQTALVLKAVAPNAGGAGAFDKIAFSPDGRFLASVFQITSRTTTSSSVRLWDSHTGQEVRALGQPPEGKNWVLAFSPDGRQLMASGDRLWSSSMVKVWDVATGLEAFPPCRCGEGVKCAAFSPDGRELAAGLRGGTVKVWDAHTGKEVRVLRGHVNKVETLTYSPDGRWLISGADSTVKFWDARTGQEQERLRGPTNQVLQLACSPDGARLAVLMGGTPDVFERLIKVWDLTSGQAARMLCVHEPPGLARQTWSEASNLAYSPDGERLATSGIEGKVRVWDPNSGRQLLTLPGQTQFQHGDRPLNICPIVFSPDGRWLASATDEGTVHVWDVRSEKEARALAGYDGRVTGLAFSQDGRRLATGGLSYTFNRPAPPVRVWEVDTGREIASLVSRAGEARVVAFKPDGQQLLIGDANPSFAVTGRTSLKEGQGPPWTCWDLATGKEVAYLEAPPRFARCAVYSPDGRWLVTNGDPGDIVFWDPSTGKRVKTLRGHRTHVQSVAFSRDGRRLASASEDVEVKFWDTSLGRELLSTREPTFQVFDEIYRPRVAIRPDGKQLAWCGYDGAVRSWDAEGVPAEARQAVTLTWHRFQAEDAEGARHWFAASFHLSRLIEAEPANNPHYVRRARAHAELGQWQEAAADLARATELEPNEQLLYYQMALVRLRTGDLVGYRASCADMLRHFGQTQDPGVANSVAWNCALGPDAVTDWPPVVRLAEKAVAGRPGDSGILNTLGACLYRAGQLEPAVQKLNAAVKAQRWGGVAGDWLFLAMAHQRLGHAEEARHWLDQAARNVKELDSGDVDPGVALSELWEQRLELRLLHQEAEALIRGQAAGPKP